MREPRLPYRGPDSIAKGSVNSPGGAGQLSHRDAASLSFCLRSMDRQLVSYPCANCRNSASANQYAHAWFRNVGGVDKRLRALRRNVAVVS